MPKCGAVRLLEQMRFERSVPAADNAFEIVLFSYSGVPVPARNNNSTERDQGFESGFLQRRVCEPSVPQRHGSHPEAPLTGKQAERRSDWRGRAIRRHSGSQPSRPIDDDLWRIQGFVEGRQAGERHRHALARRVLFGACRAHRVARRLAANGEPRDRGNLRHQC